MGHYDSCYASDTEEYYRKLEEERRKEISNFLKTAKSGDIDFLYKCIENKHDLQGLFNLLKIK
jgi:hypothetical protein